MNTYKLSKIALPQSTVDKEASTKRDAPKRKSGINTEPNAMKTSRMYNV